MKKSKWHTFRCWMGWHLPTKQGFFDGCSNHSTCRWCEKDIMQDGQGNWF